ncbi:methylated-DNA--[protein]-cysteine S-methyltransferase [Roseateles sp.]|uniref:methylated-DNA--[protein]-cysteine S-methyltransferase n=1 Tax=Roseateles sp. TaxID=1971397 RepID=UPI0039E84772
MNDSPHSLHAPLPEGSGRPSAADIGTALQSHEPLWAHCFDTALGRCGVVWSGRGIVASLLPDASPAHLRHRHPTAELTAELPPSIAQAVDGIRALLAGEMRDLCDIVLDERGIPEFRRQVHALTRAIPPGQTRTYGEIAVALGQPGAARAVGRAEGDNPFPPIVPCHRVMGAGGEPTGFSAPGGVETKRRMLLIEARAAGQLAGDQQPLF